VKTPPEEFPMKRRQWRSGDNLYSLSEHKINAELRTHRRTTIKHLN